MQRNRDILHREKNEQLTERVNEMTLVGDILDKDFK